MLTDGFSILGNLGVYMIVDYPLTAVAMTTELFRYGALTRSVTHINYLKLSETEHVNKTHFYEFSKTFAIITIFKCYDLPRCSMTVKTLY